MNSRPLTLLSATVNDLQPLRQGHSLLGILLNVPKDNVILNILFFSSRWTIFQRLKNQFWRHWNQEYLNELQVFTKRKKVLAKLQIGQLVLLKERTDKIIDWKCGQSMKTYKDEDGLIHVMDLKTFTGLLRRNITREVPFSFNYDVRESPIVANFLNSRLFSKQLVSRRKFFLEL